LPVLTLTLFGSIIVALVAEEQVHPLTLSPRTAELLAFLALGRGRFFARAEIAECVWGEASADVSHGTVATALWRLRRNIERAPARSGDFITTNRQGAVGLNGPAPVALDVAEFERLSHGGLSKDFNEVTDGDLAGLRAAVEIYRGSVLADFSSDWVLRERERLRRIYVDALGRLMHVSAFKRDYGAAIRYGQAILYADSLREDIHRDLMRYFVLNGQRALALRQYETCRAALKHELAIPPMRETTAVYQRITDNAFGRGPADAAPTGLASLTSVASDAAPAVAGPSTPGNAVQAVAPAAVKHIETARLLIAQADSHLQLSLDPPA
jgi:DNA-binding SARP family transcriptional activator